MQHSISKVCPNCITELKFQKKKLGGGYVNWFVCPDCGFRERPVNEGVAISITGQTIDRIKFRNNQQNK